jgi:hypothetical protein
VACAYRSAGPDDRPPVDDLVTAVHASRWAPRFDGEWVELFDSGVDDADIRGSACSSRDPDAQTDRPSSAGSFRVPTRWQSAVEPRQLGGPLRGASRLPGGLTHGVSPGQIYEIGEEVVEFGHRETEGVV